MKTISEYLRMGRCVLLLTAPALYSSAFGQRGTVGYIPQVNLGDRALAAHKYSAAAFYFRTALQWNSNGVAAHVGLGTVYLQTSHRQKAREEFAAVLKISPHSADAERGIHEARSDGEEQEAFQVLEDQVPKEPKNADIHTTYSEELLERDRVAEAKAQALVALKLDPHQWHAYGVLGQIAIKDGDLKSARSSLEAAVRHDDTDDDSLAALGELEILEKNYVAALRNFRQLVKVAPEESEGHRKLAKALDLAGQPDAAKQERALADSIEAAAKSKEGKS